MKLSGIIFCVLVVAIYGVARAQPTPDYDSLIQEGKTQLQAGNSTAALASGQHAIQLDAKRWEAYALAGGALMNLKRYEEAADDLSEAIKYAPEAKQAGLRDLRRQCVLAETNAAPAPAQPITPASPQPATTTQAEIVLWKTIENSANPDDFQGYLSQFPNGAFVVLARKHLSDLQAVEAQQMEQEAAARAKLPVATPLLDGTLVKQGQLIFIAIPSSPSTSTIFYFVNYHGEPALQFFWENASSWSGKVRSDGHMYFMRKRVALRSNGVSRTISDSDFEITNRAKAVEFKLRANLDGFPGLKEFRLANDNDDNRVNTFLRLVLDSWDSTLQEFTSAGIDLKKLPDAETFDFTPANSIDPRDYCMCPH